MTTLLQDLRFALRQLRKSPGFTIAAVLTLALAIGANAVVFGVLNALILHPQNVPRAESLYAIQRGAITPRWSRIPTISICAIATAASTVWQRITSLGQGWIRAKIPPASRATKPAETTSTHWALSRTLAVSSTAPMSMARTARHLSCSVMHIGTAIFRTIEAWWAVWFGSNKHPFTILGVAPPEFQGTLLFISPDFWVPMVNKQQLDGEDILNARGNRHGVLMVLGHLKPGVAPAQAIADLNSIGAYLEKSYPKDDANVSFTLARSGLAGDFLDRPARAFLTGLMLLAGLILLAACANLGSLFAARAADRSREVALRLALGSSRKRILRKVFTEAVLISLLGGTAGLLGSVALLRALSAWQPLPQFHNLHVPVNPDASVYLVALLLALASGFLFGAVPVRQVLRTNPYEIVKSGSTGRLGRRITLRDGLLVVQIAICAVLVTSSLVAVRGLVRSLHGNFGFEPRNAMLVNTVLSMAGYSGDSVPAMQRRMIEALETTSRRKVRGIGFLASVGRGLGPVECLYRPSGRSEAFECRCQPLSVQHISQLLSGGRHIFAGRQGSLLA